MLSFHATGTVTGGGSPSANNIDFIDGAEHYATQDDKWKGPANPTALASGVPGAHGLVCDDSVWDEKNRTLGTATDEISVRFRVRFRVDTTHEFLYLYNGTNFHFQLRRNANDTLTVVLPGGVTHVSTHTFAIDTWYEFEVYCLVHNTAGAYRVKVDGVVPNKSGGGTLDQSGLDTQAGGSTTIANVGIGSATLDTYTDDHVIDVSGAEIGLGQVETAYPNGAGDLTELTRGGTDSGANWSQVDEAIDTGSTDYNRSTASSQRDCYVFQDRSISGTPKALQVAASIQRHISGTFTFKFFVRIDGVNYDSAITRTASSAAEIFTDVWNNNPATGNAWTDEEINNTQLGVLCVDANVRVNQLVREVFVVA